MNKKELVADIKANSTVEIAAQRCPYSFVRLHYGYRDVDYIGYGFSKVCYPDEWSAETGSDKAYYRAISDIYQQIREIGNNVHA